MGTRLNTTTKEDALEWLRTNRNVYPPEKIIRLIYGRCFLGEEYKDIVGENCSQSMSAICRAYSITRYNTTRNDIKNIYKKYLQKYDPDQITEAISNIIYEYPNGIVEEYPRFEELLHEYLEGEDDYEEDYYNDENDGDLSSSNRGTAVSPAKIGKIALPLIAVIVLIVIVVNLRHIILPILGGIAVVALVIFVYKNMKGSQKNNSSASYGRTVNRTKRSTGNAGKITFGKLAGAVAWAGIFIYAGSYYHNAGNPTSWMIAAIAIGIVGAGVILFRPNNK